jgi:thiamine transport system substrate-binding protein
MKKIVPLVLALGFVISSCSIFEAPGPEVLTVMTHDSFSISEEVIQAFEAEHDVEVQFLKSGRFSPAIIRSPTCSMASITPFSVAPWTVISLSPTLRPFCP